MSAPRPKIVSQVCSLCGLEWKDHGEKPTAETCVRLLLDEVRSLNAQLATRPIARPYPYVPLPVIPWSTRPYWPTWYSTGTLSAPNTASPPAQPPYAITVKATT